LVGEKNAIQTNGSWGMFDFWDMGAKMGEKRDSLRMKVWGEGAGCEGAGT